jgi:hypothetical protein
MSTKPNDGGPAFPGEKIVWSVNTPNEIGRVPVAGMSLRTWLAGMAMQGHLANPTTTAHPEFTKEGLAVASCRLADALIAELEKEAK